MGKLFYDNSEVRAQFEPLDGVIAYQKHNLKKQGDKKDEAKFYAKYKIKQGAIDSIAEKQTAQDSVAKFNACEEYYSDPEDDVDGPGTVDGYGDASKLTINDVDVENISAE